MAGAPQLIKIALKILHSKGCFEAVQKASFENMYIWSNIGKKPVKCCANGS